jgi:hypothetical protein
MVVQSFSPVSEQRWEDIKATFAEQAGLTIAADAGTGEAHGVKFSWAYGGGALGVTVDSVAWPLKIAGVSEQSVMDKFAGWIAAVE